MRRWGAFLFALCAGTVWGSAPGDILAAMDAPSGELRAGTDPYLWLEDVSGEAALDWVRAQNEPTLGELCGERFEQMRAEALEIGNADTRIPTVKRRGDYLYNLWTDADYRRDGIVKFRTGDNWWRYGTVAIRHSEP